MATMTKTRRKPKADKVDVYAEVAAAIDAALAKGVVPWRKTWTVKDHGAHRSFVTKKAYRGINIFLLDLSAHLNGFASPQWMTFNQADTIATKAWEKAGKPMKTIDVDGKQIEVADKGGVRKGEKSTLVTFWKMLSVKGDAVNPRTGNVEDKMIPMLRHFRLFNLDQIDGIDSGEIVEEVKEMDPIAEADAICDGYVDGPLVSHKGQSACYMPGIDEIYMPLPEAFESPEAYYSTRFHEMVHSTGHESRLARGKGWEEQDGYGKEELVAEMGASFLCGVAKMEIDIENSAAYIAHWRDVIKAEPKIVISAAGAAQKAADYIRQIKPEEKS